VAEQASLADQLTQLGYFGLIQQEDDVQVRALSRDRQALTAVVDDVRADPLARFLAAELLFAQGNHFPSPREMPEVAQVYATALKENFTESANTWGLPGMSQGLVAEHVVSMGPAIVPAFAPLLDDDTRVHYEGSEEATIGNIYAFRVKDVAAALIAAVTGRQFELERDPKKRDATIASLVQAAGT
jgi:hypothetical protein